MSPSATTSSLVAGLGDEVLLFVATALLGGLVLVAWWSSAVRERPRVQAVLLQPLRPGVLVAEQVDAAEARRIRQTEQDLGGGGGGRQVVFAREESAAAVPTITNVVEPAVEAVETDPVAESAVSSDNEEVSTNSTVTIKLKFLNDSQREVRAPLTESIGRFKRRHFASALAENKNIRLIFNGHVLNGDQQPLSHFGLFDNCVVHCLESTAAANARGSNGAEDRLVADEEDNLDLSHICYPMLGSVLVIIWWCQLIYSHYFSLASTISLVSLTVLFLASISNTYLY